jgi:hypothetical protein
MSAVDLNVSRPRRIHSARPDQRERPQPRPLKSRPPRFTRGEADQSERKRSESRALQSRVSSPPRFTRGEADQSERKRSESRALKSRNG